MPRQTARDKLVVRRVYASTRIKVDTACDELGLVQYELIDQMVDHCLANKTFMKRMLKLAPTYPLTSDTPRAVLRREQSASKKKAAKKKTHARKKTAAIKKRSPNRKTKS